MLDMSGIESGAKIGHVHLKVANLATAVTFYCDVLGFELMQMYGNSAAFVSAGGYHHHIGLNTWQSKNGQPPAPKATGLFHLAILMPDRPSLARIVKRVMEAGYPLDGASDHGVSEAVYFRDPDQNGIEVYVDRDPEFWPRNAAGGIEMVSDPLDLESLLREA